MSKFPLLFENKKRKESPIIFWQTPNRQIIVDFLGFFRRIFPISLKIQREVQYVSSRNNFVKAIFWFLCGCFYTFFAWSQRFKSGCFLFKRNKNFWISFESNGNVVRKMTLVTDVSGRIDQIWLGFGCYMKTFCVSWPDVRYAYLSQYIEYIFCMRFQTV